MTEFRLIVRRIKGRKSFRCALDSVACSKVILLASESRFGVRLPNHYSDNSSPVFVFHLLL